MSRAHHRSSRRRDRQPPGSGARRGGVLFEVLVAVAVFVAAATMLLGIARESLDAMGRAERRELAVDLARDALSRLATGEINIEDLRAGRFESRRDDGAGADADPPTSAPAGRFRIDVRTERSSFAGLVLVELRVRSADAAADDAPLCTLRQLVRLGRRVDDSSATPEGETARQPGPRLRSGGAERPGDGDDAAEVRP
ncbi:MAG: hypothetical protein U0575_10530 [Phycisphaerales bacterium]